MGEWFHLNKLEYSLDTYNITKSNKWATFRDEKNGRFFIHSGEKKAPKGVFTFKEDLNVNMVFSIKKGGDTLSDIEFKVLHNEKEIAKKIVTIKNNMQVAVSVKKGDKVTVIADKIKRTAKDWGNLQVTTSSKHVKIKNFTIIFLWSILFIFLISKNYINIGIILYLIFYIFLFSENLNFGVMHFYTILVYMFFLFSIAFVFMFIYQELKIFKISAILSYIIAISVYIIPLLFIIYALNFDVKITEDILYAIFQSNRGEVYDFINVFISTKYILLFMFITLLIGFLFYKQEKKETKKINKLLLIFISITLLVVSLTQFSKLRLLYFLQKSFKKYRYELNLFKEVQAKRKTGIIKFYASKKEQGETYIIVIGESQNKKHMGLYGYIRKTTPELSKMKDDLIIFHNTYSNHTHTVPVMKLALTEANQYNKEKYYNSLSIIDILKKADIKTYWLTNQTIYGVWDNMISVIAISADHIVALNSTIGKQIRTQKYDGALIDEVKKVLAEETEQNRVIFVHLIGNHFPYTARYPNEYNKFAGKLNLGEFGTEASKNNNINKYDNSMLYNDYVVSSIIKELKKEKGINGFLYMADHTDDLIGLVMHSSSKFTYQMTQIPMFAWFNSNFKNIYNKKYNTLLSRTDLLYSNDMLYNTMIGLFGVKTDRYNAKYDFTSSKYSLNPKDALVLHGRRKYTDKSNAIYWQKENAKYLIETAQSSRIFPHRVNSIGKLKDIWADSFRSFELDVRFGDNNTKAFQVGHNHGVMGVSFEKFLTSVDSLEIQRVWFDFKNLNTKNYKDALFALNKLDEKYSLKNRLIIESGTKEKFFKKFRENNWHTSYYLPTETVVEFLRKKDKQGMKKLSVQIAKQVENQKLSAVSFDSRLYLFVKEYLELKISKKIVYHIWYSPALYDANFKNKLLKNELYLDNRVKTLLGVYKSQFNL